MSEADLVIENYQSLAARIAAGANQAGRDPRDVRLVAVSKGQAAARIQILIEHLNHLGEVPILGESYVQEWREKKGALLGQYQVHGIGALQSNKVREAVQLFDVLEGVGSEKTARLIDSESRKQEKISTVFLQVNVSADPRKKGFSESDLRRFVGTELGGLLHLRLQGLMTIPRNYANKEEVRADYARLRRLRDEIVQLRSRSVTGHPDRLELSMGMSDDFEIAVAEGATLVRIGTALFGERG